MARLSGGRLCNLPRSRAYRPRRLRLEKTRPTTTIGERRPPPPQGRPGYRREDTAHSPEQDGEKGARIINLMDEGTP